MKAGTVISVCSDDSATCVEMVRAWCKGYGYTTEEVRIVKRNGQIIAELKIDSEK